MADENKGFKGTAKNAGKATGGLVKEFKQFISKGNVVDMAVGIIIGGAFTSIVNSLVADIFTPLIGVLMAGVNFSNLVWEVPFGQHPVLNFGSFIQNIISFFLTALCLFMVIKFMNAFKRKQEAVPPKPTKDQELLTEIRDLLKEQVNKD